MGEAKRKQATLQQEVAFLIKHIQMLEEIMKGMHERMDELEQRLSQETSQSKIILP